MLRAMPDPSNGGAPALSRQAMEAYAHYRSASASLDALIEVFSAADVWSSDPEIVQVRGSRDPALPRQCPAMWSTCI